MSYNNKLWNIKLQRVAEPNHFDSISIIKGERNPVFKDKAAGKSSDWQQGLKMKELIRTGEGWQQPDMERSRQGVGTAHQKQRLQVYNSKEGRTKITTTF